MSQNATDIDVRDPGMPLLGGNTAAPKMPRRRKRLVGEVHRATLRQLEEWYEVERMRQAPNRYQMAIDHDFYDNLQWADDDADVVLQRGQAPLVYNKVQPAVKWITGTEKRTRIDYQILPRTADDVDTAGVKTKLIKYVDDVNKSGYVRSRAFEDAVKVGVGWMECGIRGDPTQELLYDRWESWRNVIYDSTSAEYDLSDARYLFRDRWTDLDIAIALFPEYAADLRMASVYSDFADAQDNDEWYLGQLVQERTSDGTALNRRTFIDSSSSLFNRRARVKLHETWYRKPTIQYFVHQPGGKYHGERFDDKDTTLALLFAQGAVSTYQRMAMQMRVAVWVKGTLLQDQESPYKHNDFPFTPVWANRRGRDNAPYGIIRVIRDPQEDFNKRMSKALHAISTRRVIMDKGAVLDIEELRDEVASPDAIIEVEGGKKLVVELDDKVAQEHIEYAQLDAKMIQDQSGVTDELLGKKTNAISGTAIEARQDQGSTVTTDLFDNQRLAVQLHGQKKLSLTRQFYTDEKVIRITGSRRTDQFIAINQQTVTEDGQSAILNDITAQEADFIVSETDYRASSRQAMAETLTNLVAKMPPQDAMMLLDNVVELYDIPGVEELVATIRQINGKPDPDHRLTPQEQEQMQMRAQRQQQMQDEAQEVALATAKANLAQLEAKANELNAKAASLGQQGDGGKLAASYQDKLHALQRNTDGIIFTLRKELMEAEQRADDRALDAHTKVLTANVAASTTLRKTALDNASRERIAALNDRTLEATKGLAADIADLDAELQQVADVKLDKPTPQQEAKSLIAEHNDKIKADREKQGTKDAIAKTGERVQKVEQAVKQIPAPEPAPDSGDDSEIEFQHDESGRMTGMHVKGKGGTKHVRFKTDSKGRIVGARVKH